MNNSFSESIELPEEFIVVEKCDSGGGILGYEVMSLKEAQKQSADPRRQKMEDRMIGVLHGSDLEGKVFWREWEGPMSKEQAEDLVKVWDVPSTMTYNEYNEKWKKK